MKIAASSLDHKLNWTASDGTTNSQTTATLNDLQERGLQAESWCPCTMTNSLQHMFKCYQMVMPAINLQCNEWSSFWATVYVLGWLTVTGSSRGASMSACLTSMLPWQARHNIRSNAARRSRTITPAINLTQEWNTLTNTCAYQKCYQSVDQTNTATNVYKHTWTRNNNNNNNRFMAFYPGLPGWDGTRKTFPHSHLSLSSTTVISFLHLLWSIASSLFNLRGWVFLHNLSPSPHWSTSWSHTLVFLMVSKLKFRLWSQCTHTHT